MSTQFSHPNISKYPQRVHLSQIVVGLAVQKDIDDNVLLTFIPDNSSQIQSSMVLQPLDNKGNYVIKSVYTSQLFQRQGLARSLLMVARNKFKSVRHSDYLSGVGELWANSVEGIKHVS